jgi:hypothetical protein
MTTMPTSLTLEALQELRDNLVPEEVFQALEMALPIIERVCGRAGMDFDEEEGDDANLFGQQCSRRGRNLIAREVEAVKPTNITVERPRNTLYVQAGPTRVYFWAAGDDAGSPRLRGGKTKPEILDHCVRQLELWQDARTGPPAYLVVAYRATPSSRRLEKVVVGLPKDVDQWDFAATIYDRPVNKPAKMRKPMPSERFDNAQPPAPVIQLKSHRDKKSGK